MTVFSVVLQSQSWVLDTPVRRHASSKRFCYPATRGTQRLGALTPFPHNVRKSLWHLLSPSFEASGCYHLPPTLCIAILFVAMVRCSRGRRGRCRLTAPPSLTRTIQIIHSFRATLWRPSCRYRLALSPSIPHSSHEFIHSLRAPLDAWL